MQIDLITDNIYRRILVIHIRGHLDELGVRNAEIANIQVITCSCPTLIEEHHGLFAVDAHAVELFRKDGILVEQHILALWGAHLVIVDLLRLVDVGELLSLGRSIIGTIVESVTLPGST